MLGPLIFTLHRNTDLAAAIAKRVAGELGTLNHRRFPDGESYIRIVTPVKGRDVIIVTDISDPDSTVLPLLFTAYTAASLGALSVGLVAPYLPYMRQDKAFQSGECVSAQYFANLISGAFDWMVTVDPHLHRITDLADVYALDTTTLSASSVLVGWVKQSIVNPLIIGPDTESEQWVKSAALTLGCPYVVAAKTRCGDRCIETDLPDMKRFSGRRAIIIDDIISTGTTVVELIKALDSASLKRPICLAVHDLMTPETRNAIIGAGAEKILVTDSIKGGSYAISIAPLLSMAVNKHLSKRRIA